MAAAVEEEESAEAAADGEGDEAALKEMEEMVAELYRLRDTARRWRRRWSGWCSAWRAYECPHRLCPVPYICGVGPSWSPHWGLPVLKPYWDEPSNWNRG